MMEEKVLACIEKHNLITPGNNVIVALSGGADSVALFHFLLTHRQRLGITLAVAHFEHGLRGEESLENAAYVQSLCAEPGLAFFIEHGEMAGTTPPKGVGVEEWGRRLRYAFFDRLAAQQRARVATAHTLTDNAETVLFNAVRGAGPKGLSGIPPVRGPYIRPLLWVTREEVEAYCAAHGLKYIQDSYNFDPAYSRNRLRMQVMPQLEKVHPGAKNSLARMAEDMAELDGWLEVQAAALLEAAKSSNGAGLDAKTLLGAPGPVRLKALAMMCGRGTDRAALGRVQQVLAGNCRAAQLPGGRVARLHKGRLAIDATGEAALPLEYEIPLKEGTHTLPGSYRLEVTILPAGGKSGETEKTDRKGLTFVADYDKIQSCSVLRCRKAGDTFTPQRRGLTKTLKKWMNEAGIPQRERGCLPLLCSGGRVLWIWGHGFCEGLQPGAGTKRLLVLKQAAAGGREEMDD